MDNLDGFREEEEEEEEATSRSGEGIPPTTPPMDNFPRALRDYALPPVGVPLVIKRLAIQANKFEIKPITLQLIQNIHFIESPPENQDTHISNFFEVCDTFKYNGG